MDPSLNLGVDIGLPPSHAIPPHLHKRRLTREHPNGELLPLSDRNAWYYPSQFEIDDDDNLDAGLSEGNWGHKNTKRARWIRRGKMAAWGPEMEDWEAEERARKRIRLLLTDTQEPRSPSPPTLPHLAARSPSPPLVSPYPPPHNQHTSYSSFVLDKSVTHTFRSTLVDELENATNELIEGETTLKRALGRLWQVMSEDLDTKPDTSPLVPKLEDEDEPDTDDDQARRVARAPDLTPATHKIFLLSYPSGAPPNNDSSHFSAPDNQLTTLEKSLGILRELQDDTREYLERLAEIREGLGDVRAQRDAVWDYVREKALTEMQEAARMVGSGQREQ